jgi:Holliday junction DNA helicase RuvA
MIYSLNGILSERDEEFVVLDVNGVGYQVYAPLSVIEACSLHSPQKLFTYHHIREDQQTLFGFLDQHMRQWFILLMTVSGLGPKGALKVLSSLSIDQLTHALMAEDVLTLTRVQGVGKKLAERMIIELKDKIGKLPHSSTLSDTNPGLPPRSTPILQDLTLALKSLGYSADEIRTALSRTPDLTPEMNIETGIKAVLRHLV